MIKSLALLAILLLLMGGCGGKPTPTWIAAGHQQLESFKGEFLTGAAPRLVDLRFQKVQRELKKGGDLDLLQKAWLTRMALQVASRETMEPGDYPALEAALAVPPHRAFYRFLAGEKELEAELLPVAYRPFWQTLKAGGSGEAAQRLTAIEDPLSRLIAAGVAARHLPPHERLLLTAVDTASENGWQRPLLAWLKELKGFYESTGDKAKAEMIGRRIALITP